MNVSSFDDLLRSARAQDSAQRLLFVFAGELEEAARQPLPLVPNLTAQRS